MTVNQLLIKVRQKLHDMSKLKYSDEELVYCLNNAIDKLSLELADSKTPDFVKEFQITASKEIERPNDFIEFVGQYPIAITEQEDKVVMELLDSEYPGSMIVRYFALRPKIRALTDKIPFYREWQTSRLINYTVLEADPMQGQTEQGAVANDNNGSNTNYR